MYLPGNINDTFLAQVLTKSLLESKYRNVPKFSDRQVWANSADPDQTSPKGAVSDQGLHC